MAAGYRDIAEHYRNGILTGHLGFEQALPSVRDVAKKFEVTDKTAHHGLHQLVLEGLARVTTKGFIVTYRVQNIATLRVPIDGVRLRGFLPVEGEIKEITHAGLAPTPAAIADMFGIEADKPSVLRQGRIIRDGHVVAHTMSRFPAKWAERIPELLIPASTSPGSVARIEAIIGRPTEVTNDRMEVDVANEDFAKIFGVPVNDPIMIRTTIRHDGDDVVEYGQAFTPRNVAIENEYRRRAED
jgi:DNA-binding GntR family transcriptional regulator